MPSGQRPHPASHARHPYDPRHPHPSHPSHHHRHQHHHVPGADTAVYPPIYPRGLTPAPTGCGSLDPPLDTALRSVLWKDLPALPSSYRLGEGLPWDMGMPEPAADPDDERLLQTFTQPTLVPIEPAPNASRRDDPQRKRNLEDLSAAMMTIDNGFESQWWNRGEKTAAIPMAPAPAAPAAVAPASLSTPSLFIPPRPQPQAQPSLGWAVAEPCSPLSPPAQNARARSFTAVPQHYVVSPESECASLAGAWSPMAVGSGSGLQSTKNRQRSRSMASRSEELFFTTTTS